MAVSETGAGTTISGHDNSNGRTPLDSIRRGRSGGSAPHIFGALTASHRKERKQREGRDGGGDLLSNLSYRFISSQHHDNNEARAFCFSLKINSPLSPLSAHISKTFHNLADQMIMISHSFPAKTGSVPQKIDQIFWHNG